MTGNRRGIAGLGTWIMDHVRIIDRWPDEQTLAYVHSEHYSGGGLAHNMCIDIAKFDMGIPVEGIGFVGDDEDGRRILAECDRLGIDRTNLRIAEDAPTSYTEVMTVKATGKRTFFHSRGANDCVTFENVPFDTIQSGMVHFGYLLLMAGIDAPDPEYGTVAAKILAELQRRGIRTSVDTVSEISPRFKQLIPPALKYTDYLILNELEAGQTTGHTLLTGDELNPAALRACARALLDLGSSQLVIIHLHLGEYALTRDGAEHFQPSLDLPEGYIRGGAGAGDAFCAGVLAGIHEDWPLDKSLRFGTAAAAASMSDPTCTGGVLNTAATWQLFDRFPLRDIRL